MKPVPIPYQSTDLPPAVKADDLKYGDIIWAHQNLLRPNYERDPNAIGAYWGRTAVGAVILMNLDDWSKFQRGILAGAEVRCQSFFEALVDGSDDGCPIFIFRRLGTFLAYRLPLPWEPWTAQP